MCAHKHLPVSPVDGVLGNPAHVLGSKPLITHTPMSEAYSNNKLPIRPSNFTLKHPSERGGVKSSKSKPAIIDWSLYKGRDDADMIEWFYKR